MNPPGGMDPGNAEGQNRPSVLTQQYVPFPIPLGWNNAPGPSMSYPVPTNFPPPQGFPNPPNFQFNTERRFRLRCNPPFRGPHSTSIEGNCAPPFRCKRKTDSPPLQVSKQFITEEKMSEHLSKLKISSETEVEMESEDVKEKRLYMCEEMKKFQAQNEPYILPDYLLPRRSSECKALVLWKPPESILAPPPNDYFVEDSENNNNNRDNYNSVLQQVNNADQVTDVEFEEL